MRIRPDRSPPGAGAVPRSHPVGVGGADRHHAAGVPDRTRGRHRRLGRDALPDRRGAGGLRRRVVARLGVGYSVADVERLHRHVLGAGYYHHKRAAVMAIAALEMAMWDALGKTAGQPLWALWGGPLARERGGGGLYLHARSWRAGAAPRAGFSTGASRAFKVKIGFDADVRHRDCRSGARGDRRRASCGSTSTVRGRRARRDGSSSASLRSIRPMSSSRWSSTTSPAAALLRASQSVPIAIDESAYTLQDVGNVVRRGCGRRGAARSAPGGRAVAGDQGRGGLRGARDPGRAAFRRGTGDQPGGLRASRCLDPEHHARHRYRAGLSGRGHFGGCRCR